MATLDIMKIFAAPFFTFCVAILSLVINPPAPSKRKILWTLIISLLTATLISAYINYGDLVESKVRSEELQKSVNRLNEDNRILREGIDTNVKQVELIVARILRQGYSQPIARGTSREQWQDMFNADIAWQKAIIDRLQNNDFPKNTTIQYFQKDVDDPVFLSILKEAGLVGYTVKVEPSKFPGMRTNFLLATDGVPVRDVQLAALTLLRNGIRLQFVGRECKELQHQETLIQIGTETRLQNLRFIKAEDLLEMNDLAHPNYCAK